MSSTAQEAEVNQNLGTEKPEQRTLFDKFVLFLAVVEPLTTIPQIYQVWIKGQTAGVSALTWALYCLVEMIWLIYGIKKKDKAVIAASLAWGIVELVVAIGAVIK